MNDFSEAPQPSDSVEEAKPHTSAQLLARLEELNIPSRTISHPPVFTVEEAKALRGDLPGAHSKNLFLRDKKGSMWLVSCLADKKINLRALGGALGARSLSFASHDRLSRYLGVIPGAVTPFAVINDRAQAVRMVIDRELLSFELLNFHPLDNAQTTAISSADLLKFLRASHHDPQIIAL